MTGGYKVGPTLAPGESPFAPRWEQDPRIDNGHHHDWESVMLPPRPGSRFEECVRCAECGCPRCGHSTDDDPCMKRRHHRGWHLYLSGRTEMVGGES